MEKQPVATALASTAAATIAAARAQLAEDSAAASITITGVAAIQAVQSGRQPASSRVKRRQPLASTARLLVDNVQAVGLGAVRQQAVPADRHMIQQQPDVTAASQRSEDVWAAQDVMQLEQFRDMHFQQQPPIAPLMPESQMPLTGAQPGGDIGQLTLLLQQMQQLPVDPDDVAGTDALGADLDETNAGDSMQMPEQADSGPSTVIPVDATNSVVQDFLTDLLGPSDSWTAITNPQALHDFIHKLKARLIESHQALQHVFTQFVQQCETSTNLHLSSMQQHIKAAQAELQPPGEQGQGERPAGSKYDDWALSAYRVAGPHLALYRTNPDPDTQLWLFVLTGPEANSANCM